jgi:hypothetical protein
MGRTKGSKNKLKIVGGQLPEVEIIEMAERAKNYQGPAMAVPNGTLVVTDPILAAEMATSRLNADHKNHKPLPDNWHELSKTDKLKFLTENPRR